MVSSRSPRGPAGWLAGLLLLIAAPLVPAAQPAPVPEADDPSAWLERMIEAARTLSYRGVFIYQHGSSIETLRIVHRYDGEGERERLLALTGDPREVIRDDETVTCIFPDTGEVMVDRSRPASPFPARLREHLDEIVANYQLSLSPGGRVTGRATRLLEIQPEDAYRYGYRLWIDEATGMLLKSEVVDGQGRAVERLMYTEIAFPAHIEEADLEPVLGGKGFVWHSESLHQPEPPHAPRARYWQATWLPSGFALHHSERMQPPEQGQPSVHLVYGDGLTSVSVYIEPRREASPEGEVLMAMGAVHTLRLRGPRYVVTVVGEAPGETIKRIGRSIRPVQEARP